MYDTKMSVGTIMKTPIAPTGEMFAKVNRVYLL